MVSDHTFQRLKDLGYTLGAPAIRGEDGVMFVGVNDKLVYPVDAYQVAHGLKTLDQVCADYPEGQNCPPPL